MKAALESFNKTEIDEKVLFLGDMFELGESAEIEHQAIADLVHNLGFKNAYLIGENFFKTTTRFEKFNSFLDLILSDSDFLLNLAKTSSDKQNCISKTKTKHTQIKKILSTLAIGVFLLKK